MDVWVLSGETITDIEGEVLESGTAVGVFDTYEAEAVARDVIILNGAGSYWRKDESDYSIDKFSLKG